MVRKEFIQRSKGGKINSALWPDDGRVVVWFTSDLCLMWDDVVCLQLAAEERKVKKKKKYVHDFF